MEMTISKHFLMIHLAKRLRFRLLNTEYTRKLVPETSGGWSDKDN
jgi:hypothetical protein